MSSFWRHSVVLLLIRIWKPTSTWMLMWMQTIMLTELHNFSIHIHFLACSWNCICVFSKKIDLNDYLKSCPTAVFSCAILIHPWDSLGFYCMISHCTCRGQWPVPYWPVLKEWEDVRCLRQNFLCCMFVQSSGQGSGEYPRVHTLLIIPATVSRRTGTEAGEM